MTIKSYSERETLEAGERLGRLLREKLKKSRNLRPFVCLYGELGSGKTVFIKGLASAFGISPRDIGSASFVLASEYRSDPPFCHIDLYRIEDIEKEEWIWDYIEKDICAVEWAERIKEIPENAIRVYIKTVKENEREITIEGISEEDWHNLKDWQT
ncbi:MAG: tRNA (adenosine(37)-N6)-threonylcarbamoyltransferase complex ATPase subunit type 1 TsaE [Thermodesulfovibrionales bacterium]|nr:tRNA (adenosine(37)-N6)-threonylcarbamoyltransferase complex ATPase subunit type 1 TsaE [Thermodesulfovibrionales bacterium]